MTVPIPEEAIEAAAEALKVSESDATDGNVWFRAHAEAAVRAAAPLIVAAYFQALLDDAFPDEDSDYHYGCERLLDLVRDGIPALRGEGQTQ